MNDIDKDNMLLNKVISSSKGDKAYWSFKGRAKRQYCHALIQYPAMMVPALQGELIDAVLEIDSSITSIIDPFVGSGTTLGEAMCRGLDFVGMDINPLSILACEVKSGPLYIEALEKKMC
ncbi:DNA methylase [Leclercia adecarboxylata]|uniref:DNA methylase n=1 Tax=Leclercia adecarboxylata TaxID=83655 RepID=A0A4U9HH46_9ENTR|nr:DNA methylase [Leclercia adecarboxylata]